MFVSFYLSYPFVRSILALLIRPPEEDAPSFSDMLEEVNPQLERFGFSIKKLQDEYAAKLWWAFVNTKSDELAKAATEYNPQEIAYFRTLVGS